MSHSKLLKCVARLTLGHVYDMDLKKNESMIKEVIIQAQGEVCRISKLFYPLLMCQKMALEEYIKQVKEIWTAYTLDLINYQNKCRLIRYNPLFFF
jgi:dynein heavy chain 1